MNNYQMNFNGLTFGAGTSISLEVISGFEDFDATIGDLQIPRRWGDVPGLHTINARDVILELYTVEDDVWRTMLDTFLPSNTPTFLFIREPGDSEDRLVYARVTGRWFTRNPVHKFKKMASIRFRLADPRIYGSTNKAKTLSLYNPSGGGFDYGADYEIDFVGGTTEEKIVTNEGNADAYPLLRFYGPASGTVTAVKVTNITTEQMLDISSAVLINQILEADMRRIITVDPGAMPYINIDGSNRYGDWTLPRIPFYLAPGDNLLRFEITGTSIDVVCTINHRDTWL